MQQDERTRRADNDAPDREFGTCLLAVMIGFLTIACVLVIVAELAL